MGPSDIGVGCMLDAATQRFADDAKCVDLKDFKSEAESKISEYKQADVMKEKEDFTGRAQEQLQSIASFEASMGQRCRNSLFGRHHLAERPFPQILACSLQHSIPPSHQRAATFQVLIQCPSTSTKHLRV